MSYTLKRLKEEADRLGHELTFVEPEDIQVIEEMTPSATVIYKKKAVPLPNIVIPRTGSRHTNMYAFAVIRMFERLGVFVMNSSSSIDRCRNKFHTLQVLAKKGLPIPKTMLANFPADIKLVKKEFHFPIILKILSGSQGKGVMLCEKPEQLEDVMGVLDSPTAPKPELIFQEFMSESRGKDVRVIVLGGKALGAMLRVAKGEQFKSNHALGGSAEQIHLTKEMERLAVQSAKALGLNLAGVDLLFDEKGHRICEVNSSPGFEGFESATGMNVGEQIIKFAEGQVL